MNRTASSALLRLDVQARRLSLEHPSTMRKLSNTWSRRCSHIAAWPSIHRPSIAEDVPLQLVRLFSPRFPIIDEGHYHHSLHITQASPSCSLNSTRVAPCRDRFTQPISICTTASILLRSNYTEESQNWRPRSGPFVYRDACPTGPRTAYRLPKSPEASLVQTSNS
jgi:hypothetical protein